MCCSLQTTLCLQYPAPSIAVAVLHLAMNLLKCEAPMFRGKQWWQHTPVNALELKGKFFTSSRQEEACQHYKQCQSLQSMCPDKTSGYR